ncbi:hypothetical protein Dimus_008366, partial [Dionaea muscipula]
LVRVVVEVHGSYTGPPGVGCDTMIVAKGRKLSNVFVLEARGSSMAPHGHLIRRYKKKSDGRTSEGLLHGLGKAYSSSGNRKLGGKRLRRRRVSFVDGSPSLKLQVSKPGGARGMFEKHQKPKMLRGSQLEETSRVFVKHLGNASRGETVVLPSRLVEGVRGSGLASVNSKLELGKIMPYSGKNRTLKAWRRKEVSAEVPVAEELNVGVRRWRTSKVRPRTISSAKKSSDKLPVAEHGVWGNVAGWLPSWSGCRMPWTLRS